MARISQPFLFIAGVVFQHPSAAALIRELWRNGELRQLLVDHKEMLTDIFHTLVNELKNELPDLGVKTAVDSKAIPSFGKPVRDEEKLSNPDRRRDTDADWGVKSYKGVRKDGTAWEKVTKWFGYKLHLLVDSGYELPLAMAERLQSAYFGRARQRPYRPGARIRASYNSG